MPSGMAAMVRDLANTVNIADDELVRAPLSATGFVGVIFVKGKYQARVQVPGDGRGGIKKRKQHSVPGLFNTAEEAARYRVALIKELKAENEGKIHTPIKQNKEHKTRKPKQQPLLPAAPQPAALLQPPMATAMATPLTMPMSHLPLAWAPMPLPMQQIGYMPPRF